MATLGVAVPKIQFFTTPCYIGPVCQKLQVLEFFQKNVVTMATMTPPTPKTIGIFALP